jgi:hypothetical protein
MSIGIDLRMFRPLDTRSRAVALVLLCGVIAIGTLTWFSYKLDWEWQISLRNQEATGGSGMQVIAAERAKQLCEHMLWAVTLWAASAVLVFIRSKDWLVMFFWLLGMILLFAQLEGTLLYTRDLVLSMGFRS